MNDKTRQADAGEHVAYGADITDEARDALALVAGGAARDAMRALVALALRVTGDGGSQAERDVDADLALDSGSATRREAREALDYISRRRP